MATQLAACHMRIQIYYTTFLYYLKVSCSFFQILSQKIFSAKRMLYNMTAPAGKPVDKPFSQDYNKKRVAPDGNACIPQWISFQAGRNLFAPVVKWI